MRRPASVDPNPFAHQRVPSGMPADLIEKTDRYEQMLADALAVAEAGPPAETPLA